MTTDFLSQQRNSGSTMSLLETIRDTCDRYDSQLHYCALRDSVDVDTASAFTLTLGAEQLDCLQPRSARRIVTRQQVIMKQAMDEMNVRFPTQSTRNSYCGRWRQWSTLFPNASTDSHVGLLGTNTTITSGRHIRPCRPTFALSSFLSYVSAKSIGVVEWFVFDLIAALNVLVDDQSPFGISAGIDTLQRRQDIPALINQLRNSGVHVWHATQLPSTVIAIRSTSPEQILFFCCVADGTLIESVSTHDSFTLAALQRYHARPELHHIMTDAQRELLQWILQGRT